MPGGHSLRRGETSRRARATCPQSGQVVSPKAKWHGSNQRFEARHRSNRNEQNDRQGVLRRLRLRWWPSAARSEGLSAADKTGLDEMTILYPAYNPSVSLTADSSPCTGEPRKSGQAAGTRATLGAQGNSPPGLGTDQRARGAGYSSIQYPQSLRHHPRNPSRPPVPTPGNLGNFP